MTKKLDRGPAFATGGLRRPRGDLVEWPPDSKGPVLADGVPPSIDPDEQEDAQAELARAKREIKRLLVRVQELSEENERLRREAGVRSVR